MTNPGVRLIAFYLPQYHPIPENDAWWGKGFTEWTNVSKAQPLFPGHYQPHVPGDLGYYDLRDSSIRQAQADLAQTFGIFGFCYYHYWFNSKHLLEQPFAEILSSGKPELPFCLCWANENWTRAWDGQSTQILIEQKYSEDDDRSHIRWLISAFRDKRYIRISGKPVFLVYQVSKIPDPLKTTSIWREEALKSGVGDLFLCKVESFQDARQDPAISGFDAAVEFQPDTAALLSPLEKVYWQFAQRFQIRHGALICDYKTWAKRAMQRRKRGYKCFPCITPSWDNSPRRKSGAFILGNSTPDAYEFWLESVVRRFKPNNSEENLIFVNAWNEWAEGNHLEPDQKWGRDYLEATRRAVNAIGH
jgi:lipopolysaccharide biosynthesis protein